jgi:hypothetical protein
VPLDDARTGTPDVVQVADRFRLWQNLAKAVEKCLAAHRSCLAAPALPVLLRSWSPARATQMRLTWVWCWLAVAAPDHVHRLGCEV